MLSSASPSWFLKLPSNTIDESEASTKHEKLILLALVLAYRLGARSKSLFNLSMDHVQGRSQKKPMTEAMSMEDL